MGLVTAVTLLTSGHPRRALRQWRAWTGLRRPAAPLKLHVGCGRRRLEGFINIDKAYLWTVDCVADVTRLPCPAGSVDRIESYHVIEHVPHPQVPALVADWFRMLVPGGVVVVECPDFDRDIEEYRQGNEARLLSIFGRQRYPGDAHLFGYNRTRLAALFTAAGFVDVVCAEGTDYHSLEEPCLRLECRKPPAVSAS